MLHIFQDEDVAQFKLSSEMRTASSVVQNLRDYLKSHFVEDDRVPVLVLRELLSNAIKHGNRNVPERIVVASIERVGHMRFKIVVEDEGAGFDYRNMELDMPENPTRLRNRGLSLVNAFSDQIRFNEKGNRISVHVTARQETRFEVSDDPPKKVIRPVGNITAETAEGLRTLLLNLLNEGHSRFCFDFSHVEDIDSIALSIFVIFSNMVSEKFPDEKPELLNAHEDIVNLFRMTRLDQKYLISVEMDG